MLKLYNTLSKQIEQIPKKDHLNLYTCGPTVYNYAHIGNLRAFIMADLLYRTLKYDGYNPNWVMNITDIDDKTIKGAIDKYGKDAGIQELKKFTEEYYQTFLKDLAEVNVLADEIKFIRVTDVIPQIQDFIADLINKGYAYKAEDGSIYFSIEKYQKDFGDYGVLVGEKFIEGKKVGARVKVDEYEKENLSDFALWKAHTADDANIYWDHPVLGKGRPGWHIECSVINHVAFKGEPTDIHTGGVDLIFPHHTNEIAQSQALLGKGNFVKHWFHSEHILVDSKKMAKSEGNFYTLEDLKEQGFSGMDLRYLFFSAHYRSQQNFTFESLEGARSGLVKMSQSEEAHTINLEAVELALFDDLAIPDALASIFKHNFSPLALNELFGLERKVEDILPEKIEQLVAERQAARDVRDFQKADELRLKIQALGYEIKDTFEGQKLTKKFGI